MSTVLAHSGGHWLGSVVYLVPIVGFALWLAITGIRGRRERRREHGEDGGPGTT